MVDCGYFEPKHPLFEDERIGFGTMTLIFTTGLLLGIFFGLVI